MFGTWVFLITEIMFFGGMFASYAIFRWLYFAAFEGGSHILDVRLGAANTAVLLEQPDDGAIGALGADRQPARACSGS